MSSISEYVIIGSILLLAGETTKRTVKYLGKKITINKVKEFKPIIEREVINSPFNKLQSYQIDSVITRLQSHIQKESGGNQDAMGDNNLSWGLGQIYKPTFEYINDKYFSSGYSRNQLFDPEINIRFMVYTLYDKYISNIGKLDYNTFDIDKLNLASKRYNGSGAMAEKYITELIPLDENYV